MRITVGRAMCVARESSEVGALLRPRPRVVLAQVLQHRDAALLGRCQESGAQDRTQRASPCLAAPLNREQSHFVSSETKYGI